MKKFAIHGNTVVNGSSFPVIGGYVGDEGLVNGTIARSICSRSSKEIRLKYV